MSTLPDKTRRNKWIAAILIASPLFWTIPTFFYMGAQTQANNKSCEQNLKVMGIKLLLEYPANHEGRLPDSNDWVKAVEKYAFDNFRCHIDSDKTHPVSYAMNAALSNVKLSEIRNPSQVILIYETTSKDSNPHGLGEDLVSLGRDKVGVGRHHTIGYRFNYYLMADGTVRAPKNAAEVKTYRWVP